MPYYPPASTGGGAPTTRLINTTAPITGGGDLSADRTHAIAAATDSVDGYLTAVDHTALTSLRGQATGVAPVYVALGVPNCGWKSGIDLKVAATTAIFTVPAGRTWICTGGWILITAVTAGASVAFNFKILAGATAMTVSTAGAASVPAVNLFLVVNQTTAGSPYQAAAAGVIVNLNIATAYTTSTTVTGTVFATGFYAA